MSRQKPILVKEARNALTQLKMECAQELGRTQFVKENNDHYKGNISSKQNGSEGGPIGGLMVKRMIAEVQGKMK